MTLCLSSQFSVFRKASVLEEKPLIEGYLKKQSPKTNMGMRFYQTRYFVLNQKSCMLMYFKGEAEMKKGAKALGIIPLDRLDLVTDFDKKKCRFDLTIEGGRTFQFKTANAPERDMWLEAIRNLSKASVKPLSEGDSKLQYWKPSLQDEIAGGLGIDITNTLQDTAFMFSLSDVEARTLSSYFTINEYPEGCVIFGGNNIGPQFCIVLEGKVQILDEEGDKHLCFKHANDFLNASTIHKGQRIAIAKCVNNVTCLEMQKEDLDTFCEENPNLKDEVVSIMGFDPSSYLRQGEIFQNVAEDKLRLLSCIFRYKIIKKNETLFDDGSLGEFSLFLPLSFSFPFLSFPSPAFISIFFSTNLSAPCPCKLRFL